MLKAHVAGAWLLNHHPKLNPFVRLYPHHQAIGGYAVGMHREYDMWQAPESHNDFRKALRQPFPRAEIEGNSSPSPIGDAKFESHEGFRVAMLLADVLQVPWNRAAIGKASAILAAHGESRHVRFIDWQQRLQHFQLFIAQRIGPERIRRLHRNKAKELHHVVLDHIADGARFLIVTAAPFDAECLGDGDLHVIDMRVVPQRLQQDVREAQRHEVLHRFLAEIVINAEDVSLEEDGTDHIVDGRGALAVPADWLLDDDARARGYKPFRAEALRQRTEQVRTRREIISADAFVGAKQRLKVCPSTVRRSVDCDVVKSGQESLRCRARFAVDDIKLHQRVLDGGAESL